jgi:hypothetical protein
MKGDRLPASSLPLLRAYRTRVEGRAPRRIPVIVPLIRRIATAAPLVGIMLTGGILWALQERPGAPARSNLPSLVLETGDSRPLGRTGPLTDAAARSDAQLIYLLVRPKVGVKELQPIQVMEAAMRSVSHCTTRRFCGFSCGRVRCSEISPT